MQRREKVNDVISELPLKFLMALFLLQLILLTGNAGTVPQFHVQTEDIPTSTMGSRIIGGSPTTIQQYPFTVQLVYKSQFHCGGSLLTPTHVLTAAHCSFDKQGKSVNRSSLSIRAGTTFLNSGGTLHAVTSVKLHESYESVYNENDIAVVHLSTRVDVTSGVARLAKIPKQDRVVPDKAFVTAVGWGKTSTLNNTHTSVLNEVTIQKINQETCQARYKGLQVTDRPLITRNMICAGILDVGGKDACQGDSGGPLIYNGMVVGVTSWGEGCALRDYPGVYAKVARYTNWIVYTVKKLNTLNNGTGNGTNPAPGAGTLSSKIGAITLLSPLVFLMLSA